MTLRKEVFSVDRPARLQSDIYCIAFALSIYREKQIPIREKSYYAVLALSGKPHIEAVWGSHQVNSRLVNRQMTLTKQVLVSVHLFTIGHHETAVIGLA